MEMADAHRSKHKRRMLIANVVVIFLIAAITVYIFLSGDNRSNKLFSVVLYTTEALLIFMLIAWACALYRLYRDVKHSRKLLPNKKIFRLHAGLLSASLFLLLALTIVKQLATNEPN